MGENESSQSSSKKLYHGGCWGEERCREVREVESLQTFRAFSVVNTRINMSSVFTEPIGKAIKLLKKKLFYYFSLGKPIAEMDYSRNGKCLNQQNRSDVLDQH